MNWRQGFSVLKETANEWSRDNAPTLGAALAYYTVFSLAPLLVIAIGIAGLVLGQEAAQGKIFEQVSGLLGGEGARAVEDMVQNASARPHGGVIATTLGVVTLLFGASGVFGQLQTSLNTIWNVPPKTGGGVGGVVKNRILSFGFILVVGFLLLVSLILTSALAAMGEGLDGWLPGGQFFAQTLNFALGFGVITLLFAMIFKFLPDAKIAWRDVWVGAAITALLFSVGKLALGLYLGNSSVASSYGAAGSLVVLLLWVYYSAQILFFGAEFTQVYANRFGSHLRPQPGARGGRKTAESAAG